MKIQYSHGFLMILSAGRVQKWVWEGPGAVPEGSGGVLGSPGWVLGPKMAQNGPKMAPNWTQTGPKLAQAARPGPAGPGLGTVRGSKNCKIVQVKKL